MVELAKEIQPAIIHVSKVPVDVKSVYCQLPDVMSRTLCLQMVVLCSPLMCICSLSVMWAINDGVASVSGKNIPTGSSKIDSNGFLLLSKT